MFDEDHVAQLLDRVHVFDLILRARSMARAPVLSVLCYHSVGDPAPGYALDPDVIDATPEQFREQLAIVQRHFTVIGVDALCQALDSGRWPGLTEGADPADSSLRLAGSRLRVRLAACWQGDREPWRSAPVWLSRLAPC